MQRSSAPAAAGPRVPAQPHGTARGATPAVHKAHKDARAALAARGFRSGRHWGAGAACDPRRNKTAKASSAAGNGMGDPLNPGSHQREGGAAMPISGAANAVIDSSSGRAAPTMTMTCPVRHLHCPLWPPGENCAPRANQTPFLAVENKPS
ncbi:uncharacterized protein LOC116789824 isoform X3 [Chiroxiphia lanceolata]|uniref:uncharacterized protein LOC116789824 isoform X3 n=1 Tax=Chiroxiphia lanceolata TaxID=296741 RepID=UPI0013CF222E|nr:uncharacterized protein LOC116789824 isoform X3 [Chiroxiphia lanceolata]